MFKLWSWIIFLSQVLVSLFCHGAVILLTAKTTPDYFTSENYPGNYLSYSDSKWRIQAENTSDLIRLDVEDCYLESHSSCLYDGVRVYDDYQPFTSQRLGSFCGKSTPSFLSSGEYLYVWFYSDYSYEYRGFKIKYYSGSAADLKIKTEEEEESSDLGIVIGGIIGGIVVLGIVIACVGCCVSHSKKNGRTVTPANRVNITSLSNRNSDMYNAQLFSSTFVPPPPYTRFAENHEQSLAPVGTTDRRGSQTGSNRAENNRNTASNNNNGRRVSIGIASTVVPSSGVSSPSSRVLPTLPPLDTIAPSNAAASEAVHYQYEPFPLPLSPPPPYTPTPPQGLQPQEQESRV